MVFDFGYIATHFRSRRNRETISHRGKRLPDDWGGGLNPKDHPLDAPSGSNAGRLMLSSDIKSVFFLLLLCVTRENRRAVVLSLIIVLLLRSLWPSNRWPKINKNKYAFDRSV